MTIGSKVYRTKVTSDSMAWAKDHLMIAPDGSIFLADRFTHARGRHGRTWDVDDGQLMVTILLKPKALSRSNSDDLPIRLNQLNMALSIAILEPFLKYEAGLKWPNDFIINNKKLGGMLINLVWQEQQPAGIILGFGLNINNEFKPDHQLFQTAISLRQATKDTHEIRSLYFDLLKSLNYWYEIWQQERYSEIYKVWKHHQTYLGKNISVHQKDGSIVNGKVLQVLPNGDLMLINKQNKQQIIAFYQVEEVKMYKNP